MNYSADEAEWGESRSNGVIALGITVGIGWRDDGVTPIRSKCDDFD